MIEIPKKSPKIAPLLVNKKALSDYEVIREYECSIELLGHEVKSIRSKHFHLKSSFVTIREWDLFIQKFHISPYTQLTNRVAYDPERERKLFIHKKDITSLSQKMKEKWFTIMPTEVYLKWNLIKLKIALAKWKKLYEKRADIKKRDIEMDMKISLAREY